MHEGRLPGFRRGMNAQLMPAAGPNVQAIYTGKRLKDSLQRKGQLWPGFRHGVKTPGLLPNHKPPHQRSALPQLTTLQSRCCHLGTHTELPLLHWLAQ